MVLLPNSNEVMFFYRQRLNAGKKTTHHRLTHESEQVLAVCQYLAAGPEHATVCLCRRLTIRKLGGNILRKVCARKHRRALAPALCHSGGAVCRPNRIMTVGGRCRRTIALGYLRVRALSAEDVKITHEERLARL